MSKNNKEHRVASGSKAVLKRLTRVSFVGLIIFIVAIVVLYFGIVAVMRLGVKAESRKQLTLGESRAPSLGEIAQDEGEVVLAEYDTLTLLLDTESLNVKIKDSKTGRVFNSLPDDSKFPASSRSPLLITYLGQDNSLYEWDAFTYVISNKRYSIEKIENGARILFDFMETDSFRLGEYMPNKISIERYEDAFLNAIEQKVSEGVITEEKAKNYLSALNATYQRDEDNNCYFNKFAGLPPTSVVRLLIELTRTVDYTTEMLMEDSAEFGLTVQIIEPAAFKLYMDVWMDNGDLVVNIPTYEQAVGNDFYTLQNIAVFPAFDCVTGDDNEGFIFVPDGSGLLIALDSYDGRFPEYSRAVYNNTLFDTMYFKSEFDEELHMPVYGMYNKDAKGRSSGFMAIIESGTETAEISVKLKSSDSAKDGTLYNSVYSSFDAMQFSRVKVFGPYASDEARYLAMTGPIDMDCTIRFKLYTDGADYYTFSQDYRQHLIEQENLTVSYDNRPKLFLELIGAITVWDKFLGIPYYPTISMTDYKEATKILDDLNGSELVVNYKYGLNGGRMNYFGDKADAVRANGSQNDLQRLLERSKSGNEIFMEANLMRVYQKKNIYDSKNFYIKGYDGGSYFDSDFNDSWFPDGTFYGNYAFSYYYLVHPDYLSHITDSFLKASDKFNNIMLTDFGSHYYGNYNPRDTINPVVANQEYVLTNLQKLEESKTLALDNPNADKFTYGEYALNISRESSDYGVSYCSVPFRQLVMSGLTEFTTLDVNGARNGDEYFLLQALELGAMPKYSVFSKNNDRLMKAHISEYYSSQYELLSSDIKAFSAEYQDAFALIGDKEIVNHCILAENVFMTTYANGVNVLVNYNQFEVIQGAYTLDSFGYEIIPTGTEPDIISSETETKGDD